MALTALDRDQEMAGRAELRREGNPLRELDDLTRKRAPGCALAPRRIGGRDLQAAGDSAASLGDVRRIRIVHDRCPSGL